MTLGLKPGSSWLVQASLSLAGVCCTLGPAMADVQAFKQYFVSPPVVHDCVVKHEFGSDAWFTRVAYDEGHFLIRSERTLEALDHKRFGVGPHCTAAGRQDGQYWGYLPDAWGPTLYSVDDVSLNSTSNSVKVEAGRAFLGIQAAASGGLRGLFLGIQVWDSGSVNWSNDVLRATGVLRHLLTARVLDTTNDLPRTIEVTTILIPEGDAGHVAHLPTNILRYHYTGKPVDPERLFIPNWIEVCSAEGVAQGKMTLIRWRASRSKRIAFARDLKSYLNSSVTTVCSFSNGQERKWIYNDSAQGLTRVLFLDVPNRLFPLLFLVIAIPPVLFFTRKIVLARANTSTRVPVIMQQTTKHKPKSK